MASEAADVVAFDEPEEELERVEAERERHFGRYELCYHVASGGMASVYLARAVGPGGFRRPVAIKRIHPHLARRRQFVDMFLDEARIACRINHPNVCTIFDFGELDGASFIAMEYLMGATLGRLVNALARGEGEEAGRHLGAPGWHALAARIVADAAEGLHAAHELTDERGRPLEIVHRDVSPQNVFVTFDGAVKVVDFGIAHARDRLQHTQTGTVKGKFGYMPPEQAGGGAVDRRADVWSLGVCLWEMLVGRRLFRRTTAMETLKAVERQPIPAPSSIRAGVPEALDAIVLRCLARDVSGRPESARELARDLEAFVRASGQPTGLSDLAEWMEPLFGRERSHKSELVQTMLEVHDVSTHITPKRPRTEPDEVVSESARVGGDTASLPLPKPDDAGTSPDAAGGHALPSVARAPSGAEEVDEPAPPPAGPEALDPGALEPDGVRADGSVGRRRIGWGLGLGLAAILGGAVVALATRTEEAPARPPAPAAAAASDTRPIEPSPEPTEPREASSAAPDPEEEAGPDAPDPPRARAPRATRARARRRLRAPPTPEPEAAPEPGHVNVATVGGWAEIWHDGRRLGQTPMRVRLPAGRRTLTLRPFGRPPTRTVTVTVRPGQVTPLVVEL